MQDTDYAEVILVLATLIAHDNKVNPVKLFSIGESLKVKVSRLCYFPLTETNDCWHTRSFHIWMTI